MLTNKSKANRGFAEFILHAVNIAIPAVAQIGVAGWKIKVAERRERLFLYV
jgi:hypothetical protein